MLEVRDFKNYRGAVFLRAGYLFSIVIALKRNHVTNSISLAAIQTQLTLSPVANSASHHSVALVGCMFSLCYIYLALHIFNQHFSPITQTRGEKMEFRN